MRPILYYHTCHQYNKCSNENMQIVLFAETKFSKENCCDSGPEIEIQCNLPCFIIISYSTFWQWHTYFFLQFLAQCCLLVGFCQRICLFVLRFFFSRIHFVSRKFETNNSKMRSWISLPSQFLFLLLFVFFNKFYFCLGHHPPTRHPC